MGVFLVQPPRPKVASQCTWQLGNTSPANWHYTRGSKNPGLVLQRHLVTESELYGRRLKAAQVTAQREVEALELTQAQIKHQMSLLTEQKHNMARELREVRGRTYLPLSATLRVCRGW